MARARLEREPEILKTLCFRLGLIYADRLVDVPMALKAFQRALTYQPDDENTLVRLADLATQIGEWKLALGACERLVKNETDPDKPRRAPPPRREDLQATASATASAPSARSTSRSTARRRTTTRSTQLVQFYKDAATSRRCACT